MNKAYHKFRKGLDLNREHRDEYYENDDERDHHLSVRKHLGTRRLCFQERADHWTDWDKYFMPRFKCALCGSERYHVSYERYQDWQASDLLDALRLGVLVCCVCNKPNGWHEQRRVQAKICPAKCWTEASLLHLQITTKGVE